MKASPSDLLDQYVKNTNQAKKWTFLWVSIFCLLAVALVSLFIKNKNLMEENAILKAQRAIQSADSARFAAEASLLNTTLTVEKLKTEDSINYFEIEKLKLSNKKLVTLQENKPVGTIDDSLRKIQRRISTMKNIQAASAPIDNSQIRIGSLAATNDEKKSVLVYVQYMPKFEEQVKKVMGALKAYGLQKPEKIERISFNSMVKYFNESDRKNAIEIATIASNAINQRVEAKFIKLRVPSKQIELWLGTYKPKSLTDLKLRVNSLNRNP